jgi:iron complex outermembrane receptor protein
VALLTLLPARAQVATPPAIGTVTGKIFSPATGEFVRNAQVRVEETGQDAVSGNEGRFEISRVPAGRVTIVISYTGYRSIAAKIDVPAGATVNRDFELISTLDLTPVGGPTLQLEKFTVTGEREGSAKAIMDQRKSMNLTNTVASDTFGDNAEGNIGEFLRNMPGIELEQAFGEVRTVRLRGLSSEYTSVTVDGVSLASADANLGAAGNARAFTLETASLNSMEAIEVSKTVSADVDANAPAGTINLKTKRAFERAGRRVSWQVNVAAHSEEFSFGKSPGPDDTGQTTKLRPGGIFEYSGVFLNQRLGVVLNVSESNVYQETFVSTFTFNRTPTVTDLRPQVITALSFLHAPRFNERFSTTLTADFKATKSLVVSLGLVYNYADLWNPQRTVTFNTGARNTVVGLDPLVSFATTTAASVVSNPAAVAKLAETFTVLPRFEYKAGNVELEGKFAYSDATSWYDPLGHRAAVRDANSPTAGGISFRAERPSPSAVDWRITQTAGPDLANGASYTYAAGTANLTANDGRFSRSELMSGQLDATMRTHRVLPIVWKAGAKVRYELRKFEDDTLAYRFDYTGGGTPSAAPWAGYRSAYAQDFGIANASVTTLSGGSIFLPDLARLAQLHRDQPGSFRQNLSAANFYTAYVANHRRFDEEIRAGYLMATASRGRGSFRAGLRWEQTLTDATEFDPRSAAEVRAVFPGAGQVVNGRATTIPGLQYQYFSQPKIHRTGEYENFFPSASFKYRLRENLSLQLGYSSTIKRATYANLAGVWSINDDNLRVTAPNAGLRPETSQNYAARLAYYFEPVGQLSVTAFQNSVKDLHVSNTLTAAEFANTDPDLANYSFITTDNSSSRVRIRSLELEYSQALSFLPQPFKRLSVRATYTRNYAEIVTPSLTPHLLSGGLNYSLGRLNAYVNASWTDDVPLATNGSSFRRHRTNLDAGGGWRLSSHLTLSLSARNILNTPYLNMQWFPPSAPVMNRSEITGVSWTFAVKGVY